MQKNSRIVVTGARGLVGSALVDQLAGEGYSEVIGLGREDCDLMDGAATRRVLAALRGTSAAASHGGGEGEPPLAPPGRVLIHDMTGATRAPLVAAAWLGDDGSPPIVRDRRAAMGLM